MLRINDPKKIRARTGLNQADFWRRIGVTQSGGCRYENGRAMPEPTARLFRLVFSFPQDATRLLAKYRAGR